MASAEKDTEENLKLQISRPRFLRVICLISFVYYGIIALVFLISFILSTGISKNFNPYIDQFGFEQTEFLITSLIAFLLHALSFIGIFYIWKFRRRGFVIFFISNILIVAFQLLQGIVNWIFIIFSFLFIIFFGALLKQFIRIRKIIGNSLST